MRLLVLIIIMGLFIVYYISCIEYLTEGKGKKKGRLLESEDGSSFFAAMLFLLILFPFVVRPLMFLKAICVNLFESRGSIKEVIGWAFKSFINIFIVPIKVSMEFLKK